MLPFVHQGYRLTPKRITSFRSDRLRISLALSLSDVIHCYRLGERWIRVLGVRRGATVSCRWFTFGCYFDRKLAIVKDEDATTELAIAD